MHKIFIIKCPQVNNAAQFVIDGSTIIVLEEWVRIQLDEESNNRVIKSLHSVSGISRYWFLVGVDLAHRPRTQRWILGVEDVQDVT